MPLSFDDLAELLKKKDEQSAAPSTDGGFRDYIKNEMAKAQSGAGKKKESTMSQVFKLVGSLAPIAVGALMGGGEGAAIGAGVSSQGLTRDAAQRAEEETVADKYLRDRASGLENIYLKSGLDAENMAAQTAAKATTAKQSLLGQTLLESAKSNAAMERERMKLQAKEQATQAKAVPAVKLTKGQEQADKKFAEEYQDWTARGGYATVKADIEKLKNGVLSKLDPTDTSGRSLSGLAAKTPGVAEIVAPGRRAVIENLASVVQKTMRQIMGPQFTENEGRMLIERAFNPQLSDAENYKRVSNLLQQIETAAAEKDRAANYFEESGGTLSGYKGGGVTKDQQASEENVRVINGKKYRKVEGGWEEVE